MRGGHRGLLIGALLAAAALVAPASVAPPAIEEAAAAAAARPAIVQRPIPFGPARRAQMAAYSRVHYGRARGGWRLHPRVIVQHYTAGGSFMSAWYTFAANRPDQELGQLPGTCAHFVIDTDGTIYQLVPTTIRCRHTVGLNHVAIGIEHVGTSDAQVLANRRQMAASLRLTRWLMAANGIALRDVIGHNESLTSRFHRELYRPWATQTHGDWSRASMDLYRRKLAAR